MFSIIRANEKKNLNVYKSFFSIFGVKSKLKEISSYKVVMVISHGETNFCYFAM